MTPLKEKEVIKERGEEESKNREKQQKRKRRKRKTAEKRTTTNDQNRVWKIKIATFGKIMFRDWVPKSMFTST